MDGHLSASGPILGRVFGRGRGQERVGGVELAAADAVGAAAAPVRLSPHFGETGSGRLRENDGARVAGGGLGNERGRRGGLSAEDCGLSARSGPRSEVREGRNEQWAMSDE